MNENDNLDLRKSFGDRIRSLRTTAGLSQEELAEKSGLHPTYIGGIERGERNPSLESIAKFAQAFGISIDTLFDVPSLGAEPGEDLSIEAQIVKLINPLHPKEKKLILEIVKGAYTGLTRSS